MGNYINPADVYAEGIAEGTPHVESRIAKWEAIVERVTGNIFYVTSSQEIIVPGNGTNVLLLNTPMVAVSALKINGLDTALDSSKYRAFTGKAPPQDDRHNPKIELLSGGYDIFTRGRGDIFAEGLDQKITATWGYVEPDNSTPRPIKDAVLELVIRDLKSYRDQQHPSEIKPLTHVVRRRVDEAAHEYARSQDVKIYWSMIPRDIADVLALYRRPPYMATS